MSSISIAGDTSGSVIIAAPAVAGSTTLTLPTTSGTVLTSANAFSAGTGPAFSVYRAGANQSISSAAFTKVLFDTENFDTNNNFASSRFTPTVAGYYQINAGLSVEISGSITRALIAIYKNGVEYTRGIDILSGNDISVCDVIYCNGSTDYLEIYVYATGTSLTVRGQPYNLTYFSGAMVRSA